MQTEVILMKWWAQSLDFNYRTFGKSQTDVPVRNVRSSQELNESWNQINIEVINKLISST